MVQESRLRGDARVREAKRAAAATEVNCMVGGGGSCEKYDDGEFASKDGIEGSVKIGGRTRQ